MQTHPDAPLQLSVPAEQGAVRPPSPLHEPPGGGHQEVTLLVCGSTNEQQIPGSCQHPACAAEGAPTRLPSST
ncbi:MAG: hypothetical protein QM820_48500 [Minicystis sp.]